VNVCFGVLALRLAKPTEYIEVQLIDFFDCNGKNNELDR